MLAIVDHALVVHFLKSKFKKQNGITSQLLCSKKNVANVRNG